MKNLKTYKAFENLSKLDYENFWLYFNNIGKMEKIKELLDEKSDYFDIDCVNSYSMTALMYAVNNENLEQIKLLLDNGADINKQTYEGTALIKSAFSNNITIIKYLLDNDANIFLTDADGDDFFDFVENEILKEIIDLYPEKYSRYLKRQKQKNFNI